MKLDPDKAHRIEAAVRGLIAAGVAGAVAFGVGAEQSAAAGAIAAALVTLLSAVFVRSALAPRETPSQDDQLAEDAEDPLYDEPAGLSE